MVRSPCRSGVVRPRAEILLYNRQLTGFVPPACTIEPLTIRSRHSYQFSHFGPSDLLEIALWYARQVPMDGHDVVGLAARFRNPPLQKLVSHAQISLITNMLFDD